MSQATSNFRTIFVAALEKYREKTKADLLTHPLAAQLQSCNSSGDILAVLHDKVSEFDKSRTQNERLSSWLNPTINVLYAFSATLGGGVGLVRLDQSNLPTSRTSLFSQIFSPANVISAGVGVLLLVSILISLGKDFHTDVCQAAKDVNASEEMLADLFERIENFFRRLECYAEVLPTNAMTDIIVKIMVEVLNIFAIATKEMKQGRASVYYCHPEICGCGLTYLQKSSSRSWLEGRTWRTR
jgi:hypothetical protein